ncbi:MAG: IMP cyclohydrolase [Clostridiales bacterium]|nr:IMP cyclohydrolase [Clostridiales bacterium]
MIDFVRDLRLHRYPGRGILLGRHEDGIHAVMAYFIMGRSQNSRNRIFAAEGDGLRTKAFDSSQMTDSSLVIYHPVRVFGKATIVSNGDQTDTIYEYIKNGSDFEAALRTRTFEPDAPHFTPRISGLVERKGKDFSYRLSIIKAADAAGQSAQRFFFEYPRPIAGAGHLIHTYAKNADPLPPFAGEPKVVPIEGSIDSFADLLWRSLNESNKVSLFVRFLNPRTGRIQTRIINKNQ